MNKFSELDRNSEESMFSVLAFPRNQKNSNYFNMLDKIDSTFWADAIYDVSKCQALQQTLTGYLELPLIPR